MYHPACSNTFTLHNQLSCVVVLLTVNNIFFNLTYANTAAQINKENMLVGVGLHLATLQIYYGVWICQKPTVALAETVLVV